MEEMEPVLLCLDLREEPDVRDPTEAMSLDEPDRTRLGRALT